MLFLQLRASIKKPFVVIPMLYGSNLFISYNESAPVPWFCPKSQENELLWVNTKYIVPPIHKCFFALLTTFWDNETKSYLDWPGTKITVPDFGGETSVTYIDDGVFGHHFVESIRTLLTKFKNNGYTIRKDLFTAPYDWRLAPIGIPDFWPKLRKMIELAFEINQNSKVTLFGFSCGGLLADLFLANQDQSWKEKYIDKAILLAPSFGGTGDSIETLIRRYSPLFFFVHNEQVANSSATMPTIHCHLPNQVIYGNTTIVTGPDGRNYNSYQLRDLLADNGKSTGDELLMLDNCQDMPKSAPKEPGVPTYMLFNTGIPTRFSWNFTVNWETKPEVHMSEGDGTIPAPQFEWAEKNWGKESKMIFLNFNQTSENFRHASLITNPYVIDYIYNITQNDDWKFGNKGIYWEPSPGSIEINKDRYFIQEL